MQYFQDITTCLVTLLTHWSWLQQLLAQRYKMCTYTRS